MLRAILAGLALLVAAIGVLALALARGWLGSPEGRGEVAREPRPSAQVQESVARQRVAALGQGVADPKQILFGDLHVHTSFSFDAFMQSLPVFGGEGARPPADACDYARFCSGLDFWSINDHAEGLTPRQWRETVESIRECNEVAGDGSSPDSVAFLGWEWSQIDFLPETHYGHKNVVLRHTEDARIPARPIGAMSQFRRGAGGPPPIAGRLVLGAVGGQRGRDFVSLMLESGDVPRCPTGVSVRELPPGCREEVETPAQLFAKLDDWGHEAIVIPHGNAWGLYTPPGSGWQKQLAGHDPDREILMEIYSGHGNSEEYREWRAVNVAPDGTRSCPEPRSDYTPACWRAGEIIAERCEAAGLDSATCEARTVEARQNHADGLLAAHRTVPAASPSDWLDAGQCRDCFQPSFRYRPGGSAQAMLGVSEDDGRGGLTRFRMGFIGSSDNHTARAGTGFKEVARGRTTDSRGRREGARGRSGLFGPREEEPAPKSVAFDPQSAARGGLALFDFQRVGSFMVTGGLVAVHAEGRDRDSIWEAFVRKEVYATSGPRILLWFDLLNRGLPMGSSATLDDAPHFRVRALGSLQQKPGCPDHVAAVLGAARTHSLCLDECYHPSDERRAITRIEVIRVRPQTHAAEPLQDLIEDPWRVFECEPATGACQVVFQDPDFVTDERDSVYYVRAIEEPSAVINGANLRCTVDETGRCIEVDPCDSRTAFDDDCLSESEQRAWSSPIFVDWAPSAALAKSGG